MNNLFEHATPVDIFPTTGERWDDGFKAGEWDFLDTNPDELARHSIIASYIKALRPENASGTIVDLGCGEGSLYRFFKNTELAHAYRGFDFSFEAVKRALAKHDTSHFYMKDMREVLEELEEYSEAGVKPDVIVLNEALYYLEEESPDYVERLKHVLGSKGILIVSMSNDASATIPYNLREWNALFTHFKKLKAVSLSNEETVWHVVLFTQN